MKVPSAKSMIQRAKTNLPSRQQLLNRTNATFNQTTKKITQRSTEIVSRIVAGIIIIIIIVYFVVLAPSFSSSIKFSQYYPYRSTLPPVFSSS